MFANTTVTVKENEKNNTPTIKKARMGTVSSFDLQKLTNEDHNMSLVNTLCAHAHATL